MHLVDKVHADLPVNLIFSAFNQNTTPQVPGVLTQVSADRLVDEKTGIPYYAVRAKVAPEGMKMVADLKVRPGMPVEMFVKTGERTIDELCAQADDRPRQDVAEGGLTMSTNTRSNAAGSPAAAALLAAARRRPRALGLMEAYDAAVQERPGLPRRAATKTRPASRSAVLGRSEPAAQRSRPATRRRATTRT